MIIWLTGRPCSGKTTLAQTVQRRLYAMGISSEILDGDILRAILWPELGFTATDRANNVRRFGVLATMFCRHNIVPIVSVVSPSREVRARIRSSFEIRTSPHLAPFIEVYVNAPSDVCEQRDVKGMYAKAKSGHLPNFTGVDSQYECPLSPEVECHTDIETVVQSTDKIMDAIIQRLTNNTFIRNKEPIRL